MNKILKNSMDAKIIKALDLEEIQKEIIKILVVATRI